MIYWIIAVIALLLVGALACATDYFYKFAVVRQKEPKRPKRHKKSLSASKGLMSLSPYLDEMKLGEEWISAQEMEEISISSHDGLKLVGHLLNAHTRRTLILFHGYRSRAYRDFSCVAEYYRSLGFNLLFVDQRAHGKSEGEHITFGVKERFDCVRWAEYIDRRIGGDIFLDGISMGAGTVLMASGERLPGSVRGIIADCGFTSPAEIMEKVMTVDMKMPKQPLFWLVAWVIRLRAGFSVDEYSTIEALKGNRLPVLFLHGKADKFVPCEMTLRAYEACCAEKEIILVENAGHGVSYLLEPERCKAVLKEFVNRYSREDV